MTSDLPTAEWCLKQADLEEIYARYAEHVGPPGADSGFRRREAALRIAARVLEEDAAEKLANEMHAIIWGGHEPSGWKSFIGEARIALAYLKGEAK